MNEVDKALEYIYNNYEGIEGPFLFRSNLDIVARAIHESKPIDGLRFIRVREYTVSKDALVVHELDNGYKLVAAVVITYKEFDTNNVFEIVPTTAQNREVVKMLYTSKKGIFYNGAGGYSTKQKTSRTYLNDDEIMQLIRIQTMWNIASEVHK